MPKEQGKLIITADRCGTILEITSFLNDLEAAYIALYQFSSFDAESRMHRRRWPIELLLDFYEPIGIPEFRRASLSPIEIPPPDRLVLNRVRIESPGFWEFLGSLNPLQHIREYLNDRHRRRQDIEYREPSEKKRLELENALLQAQIEREQNSVLRERIQIYRELGYSNEEVQRILWASVGLPLSQLGRHQDISLINDAPDKDEDAA